jgi:MATE family multidrug resistance protein
MWLCFTQHLGLHGLWIAFTVSLVFSATGGSSLCISTDWDKEVKKVQDRLATDQNPCIMNP